MRLELGLLKVALTWLAAGCGRGAPEDATNRFTSAQTCGTDPEQPLCVRQAWVHANECSACTDSAMRG